MVSSNTTRAGGEACSRAASYAGQGGQDANRTRLTRGHYVVGASGAAWTMPNGRTRDGVPIEPRPLQGTWNDDFGRNPRDWSPPKSKRHHPIRNFVVLPVLGFVVVMDLVGAIAGNNNDSRAGSGAPVAATTTALGSISVSVTSSLGCVSWIGADVVAENSPG
jgi:hypothetical protein